MSEEEYELWFDEDLKREDFAKTESEDKDDKRFNKYSKTMSHVWF